MDCIGDRIKAIRKEAKLTQKDFADRLSVSRNYIYLLESGNETASDRLLKDLCNEFDINNEWLIDGTGEMKRPPLDETAAIVEEMLFNSDSEFVKLITALTKKYMQLDPLGRQVIDKLIDEALQDMK